MAGETYHPSETFDAGKYTNRHFVPREHFDFNPMTHFDIARSSPKRVDDGYYWTNLSCDGSEPSACCGLRSLHTDEIVIAVDGACRGNGTTRTRAGIGVYFGKDFEKDTRNISEELKIDNPTSQKAELHAAIRALTSIFNLYISGDRPKDSLVILQSDSNYLVKGMTEHIYKWKSNGYITGKGTPVVNKALFEELDDRAAMLEGVGVSLLFWHVSREENRMADALANDALDGGWAAYNAALDALHEYEEERLRAWREEHPN